MGDEYGTVLAEIREMLKSISDRQEELLNNLKELKLEQKRMYDEIRLNNFVLHNIAVRNEILN